jgi:zinc transport system substrate-binding protein
MNIRLLLLIAVASVGFLAGQAGAEKAASSEGKLKVFVSILPLKYFTERVGGDHVEVNVMVGAGQDVHTYEPTPRSLTELAKARVFFRAGMPFEKTIAKKAASTFKNVMFVDTSKGIVPRVFKEGEEDEHADEEHGHSHGKAGHSLKHDNIGEEDPHIWLDPKLAKIQAANIADTLSKVDPAHADDYRKNLREVQAELDALDAELARALEPLKGNAFYTYHPAFGYFADAYGLKQISVETGGKEPSTRHLAALIKEAKADGVRVIFVQPQFSKKSAQVLAEAIGGAVVEMDDLSPDYMTNMRTIAQKVRAAITEEKK